MSIVGTETLNEKVVSSFSCTLSSSNGREPTFIDNAMSTFATSSSHCSNAIFEVAGALVDGVGAASVAWVRARLFVGVFEASMLAVAGGSAKRFLADRVVTPGKLVGAARVI